METLYKFKKVKQSVKMRIIAFHPDGILLEHSEYKGLFYNVKSMDELEEVK